VFAVQETKTQYIIEVEICLDTAFHVIECPKNRQRQAVYGKVSMVQKQAWTAGFGETQRCADTHPVAYTVIHHN